MQDKKPCVNCEAKGKIRKRSYYIVTGTTFCQGCYFYMRNTSGRNTASRLHVTKRNHLEKKEETMNNLKELAKRRLFR